MNCNQCQKPLIARYNGMTVTLVGYSGFSPPHNHDDNCQVITYVCEDTHFNRISIINRCSACTWVGKETYPCSAKVTEWPDLPTISAYSRGDK